MLPKQTSRSKGNKHFIVIGLFFRDPIQVFLNMCEKGETLQMAENKNTFSILNGPLCKCCKVKCMTFPRSEQYIYIRIYIIFYKIFFVNIMLNSWFLLVIITVALVPPMNTTFKDNTTLAGH